MLQVVRGDVLIAMRRPPTQSLVTMRLSAACRAGRTLPWQCRGIGDGGAG